MSKTEINQPLTPSQTNLLIALTKYRYLTIPHMQTLAIQKNYNAIANKVVTPLATAEEPLIKHNKAIKLSPTEGRLPYIYSLTEEGVKTVAEYLRCDTKDIIYPKAELRFKLDYFHRCNYISFLIEFEKYFNQKNEKEEDISDFFIEESYHYFDKGRLKIQIGEKGNYSPTSLLYETKEDGKIVEKKIETDGIFITGDLQEKQIYIAEIHRSPNTKEILSQINRHIEAMTKGAISNRFGIQKNGYLLSVSTKETTLKNILKRIHLLPYISSFKEYLLFSHLEKVQKDFSNAWVDFKGDRVHVFK
jgi:hypothetical protein